MALCGGARYPERCRSGVLAALLPLGLGHALAVAAALIVALLIGAIVPLPYLRWIVAGILISLGVSRLFAIATPAGPACASA